MASLHLPRDSYCFLVSLFILENRALQTSHVYQLPSGVNHHEKIGLLLFAFSVLYTSPDSTATCSDKLRKTKPTSWMPPHYQRAEGYLIPPFSFIGLLPLPYFYSLRLYMRKVARYRSKLGKLSSEETGRGTRVFHVIPLSPILIGEALICKNELSIPLTILNASKTLGWPFQFPSQRITVVNVLSSVLFN